MIYANVENIKISNGIIEITFVTKKDKFLMITNCKNNLKIGDKVILECKSTNVIISKSKLIDCSLSNKILCQISSFTSGEIITTLHLKSDQFTLDSVITTNSFNRLNLKKGEQVYAYIKATNLLIKEIL